MLVGAVFAYALLMVSSISSGNSSDGRESKPRVDTDDSHLRFVTPRNKDIEFSPGAGGHVILGGVYLDERALMPVKGDKGEAGDKGLSVKGDTGSKGQKGEGGLKGETGVSVKGEKGVAGSKGAKGAGGDKGDGGSSGKDGSKGEKGGKGEAGTFGRDGRDGQAGVNGAKGDKGSAGKDVNPNTLADLEARIKALETFVNDEPPKWQNKSGLLANITTLTKQSLVLLALDPENGRVNYTIVAGQLPTSLSLDSASGIISGSVPNSVIATATNRQASFTFTVQAIDSIGKTAIQRFTIKVEGYPPADYDSGWFTFTAQKGSSSYKEFSHSFADYPARVRVLVKAIDGPNKDFIFYGVGCGVADDEDDHYTGIVFAYDTNRVRLWAPDDSNAGKNGGYAVGVEDGWGGEVNVQLSRSASVRVLAWRNSPDGSPDYKTVWTRMSSQAGSSSYKEFKHGLTSYPAVCRVLTKAVDGTNKDFIFEAVGFATSDDDADQYGGLVFGYNSSSVRLWAPDGNNRGSNGRIIFVTDGWGGETNTQSSNNADVKVEAWSSSNSAVRPPSFESKWVSISSQSGSSSFKEITHNLGVYPSLVRVLVRARNPNNVGYYFEGFGAQPGDDELDDYGGLIFAYDTKRVRIWVPDVNNAKKNGRILPLYDGWGGEVKVQQHQSTRDTADVKVQAWL